MTKFQTNTITAILILSLLGNAYQYFLYNDISKRLEQIETNVSQPDTVQITNTEYIDRPIPKYITRTVRDSLIKTIVKDGKIVHDTIYMDLDGKEYADTFYTKDSTAKVDYKLLVKGELLEKPKFTVETKKQTITETIIVEKKRTFWNRFKDYSLAGFVGAVITAVIFG